MLCTLARAEGELTHHLADAPGRSSCAEVAPSGDGALVQFFSAEWAPWPAI
jgi:hypothetical protein